MCEHGQNAMSSVAAYKVGSQYDVSNSSTPTPYIGKRVGMLK